MRTIARNGARVVKWQMRIRYDERIRYRLLSVVSERECCTVTHRARVEWGRAVLREMYMCKKIVDLYHCIPIVELKSSKALLLYLRF